MVNPYTSDPEKKSSANEEAKAQITKVNGTKMALYGKLLLYSGNILYIKGHI